MCPKDRGNQSTIDLDQTACAEPEKILRVGEGVSSFRPGWVQLQTRVGPTKLNHFKTHTWENSVPLSGSMIHAWTATLGSGLSVGKFWRKNCMLEKYVLKQDATFLQFVFDKTAVKLTLHVIINLWLDPPKQLPD